MGGNLLSCHGNKGNVNPYEAYTVAPKQKPKQNVPFIKVRSAEFKKPNAKVPNGTLHEPSSSAPATPETLRRRRVDDATIRLTHKVRRAASTLPRLTDDTFFRKTRPATPEESPDESEDETVHTIGMQHASSLLHLPVENHSRTVLKLTKTVILEMLDVDSIMASLSEYRLVERTLEMELMGTRTNRGRIEKLLSYFEKFDFNVDEFVDVLRSNKRHYPLVEYVDVHHQLIKTVSKNYDILAKTMNENSSDEIGHDCAIMHFESSYWDSETCESISLPETKDLGIPLKDAFDLKAKSERHRRSFYETMTVKDWNAHLNDKNNIIPVINVDLYNQRIGLEGAKVVANLLLKYSCIRELCLAKNDIDIHGLARIARSLSNNHGLAKLDIRLNPLGDAGADHLSRALRVNKSLRILNISSTNISGAGVDFVVGALVKNTSLSDLDIGFNDLSDTSCAELSQVLKQNIYLKRLRMRHTDMNRDTMAAIFDALKANSRVCILDISQNQLCDDGAKILADMLVSNRTLKELNLEKCQINVRGSLEIARALKANTTLKTLDLSMNNLNDYGANSISEALRYNRSLQSLCMNMCHIRNRGFLSLLCALEENKAIKMLKVCFNQIGVLDRNEDIDDYYKILGVIEDKYQWIQLREGLKILVWGNRLEDALHARKNDRHTTL